MKPELDAQINVTVRLFAGLREKVGTNDLTLTLPAESSVTDALSALATVTKGSFEASAKFVTAVNGDYAKLSAPLRDNDELAIIPPVSGGMGTSGDTITITGEPLDAEIFTQAVTSPNDGAVVTFTGVTRKENLGRKVLFLEYEAYQPMAEQKIREIIAEIKQKWDIGQVAVGHRIGRVGLGEVSMVVAVSAPHRKGAFEAALYFIDTLKKVVPIWKKEHFKGGEVWIGENSGDSGAKAH